MKNHLLSGGVLAVLSLLVSAVQAQQPQSRGSLGVTMAAPQPGVAITAVVPGGPAARIGLKPGDRILAIDGKQVITSQDVVNVIQKHKPNSRIVLRVNRGGWLNTLTATLDSESRMAAAQAAPAVPVPEATAVTAPAVQGSLVSPGYLEDLTPADIDDQHGYGG